ncbi:MAG: hypothetical protein ACLR3C_18930 [Eggerthella lenta]
MSAYQPLSLLTRTTLSRCWVMLQQESGEVYEQHGEAVTIPDEFASHPALSEPPAGSSMDLVFRDDEIAICDPDMEVRDGAWRWSASTGTRRR